VYKVSPVLTTIEKLTARALAGLFGLSSPHAGGFTTPGGSAANTTALVVARNELFPDTKAHGYGDRKFVVFASAHGHYSVEKAAQICGIGGANVWIVPVDSRCRIIVSELERLVHKARAEGFTPFFVSASAGTTVMGSFDPFPEIAKVCRRERLWFHIDAVYGGAVVFSTKHSHKMLGAGLADSVALNPHKMMGVPVTCSFLLGADLRAFWRSNTLPAGYLFHDPQQTIAPDTEHWDLADLTLQCGRRGDALKLALGWTFYGRSGYGAQIDGAFEVSAYFASLVAAHSDLELISENPPPCLQVCFYYAPGGSADKGKEENTRVTEEISRRLVGRGFMVNFSPGERGSFINAAVHFETTKVTVQALVKAVVEIGNSI
jgi:glutamate decarboxylase